MKILCFTDNHFSEKSSIISKYGTNYKVRLENQIKSMNWVEETALQYDCDYIVCLGDFFDRPHLTDQELTALTEIKWSNIQHYFLVGNHESEENNLQYSSTMALIGPNRYVISEPCLHFIGDNTELAFLPYVVESNRKSITEYFTDSKYKRRILFSHNDLLGIQMGPVVSRTGFSIEELESISDLCFNGHLHNGLQISEKVYNLGNLTGKDFSEDALKYTHKIVIIDTKTLTCEFIENPYAFNFYKIEINEEQDLNQLNILKTNAIVSIKCNEHLLQQTREYLVQLPNIQESRIIVTKDLDKSTQNEIDISSLVVDECQRFAECCRAKLDKNDILEAELAEILK